jgi:hypothetical protein
VRRCRACRNSPFAKGYNHPGMSSRDPGLQNTAAARSEVSSRTQLRFALLPQLSDNLQYFHRLAVCAHYATSSSNDELVSVTYFRPFLRRPGQGAATIQESFQLGQAGRTSQVSRCRPRKQDQVPWAIPYLRLIGRESLWCSL